MSCLPDINRDAMVRWMNGGQAAGKSARTRNAYRAAITAFCNWCVETDRMVANPLDGFSKADARSDRRRVRHSSLDLTMNVHTDPTLLDVAGAGGAAGSVA